MVSSQVVKSAFELPFPATLAAVGRSHGRSWSAHGEIRSVEVSFRQTVRGGPPTCIASAAMTLQAWAQWSIAWPATRGEHVLRARATDYSGNTQTTDPVPFNTQGYLFGGVVNHPVTVV